ncbi:type 1 fimbrial protein, partial [Franconibacter daqui]|nr:type 1 fimbrial protein [Franconibacter daqui]
MNFKKVALASVMGLVLAASAQAADQGHGKVTFTGSII